MGECLMFSASKWTMPDCLLWTILSSMACFAVGSTHGTPAEDVTDVLQCVTQLPFFPPPAFLFCAVRCEVHLPEHAPSAHSLVSGTRSLLRSTHTFCRFLMENTCWLFSLCAVSRRPPCPHQNIFIQRIGHRGRAIVSCLTDL